MKKIFSGHLYKESLRQGMAIGIIFTALFLMFAVINCISTFSDVQAAEKYSEVERVLTIDGGNFNTLYVLAFYVMTPLLIFNAFNFLTQRSRSDFYHSIPHTRVSLYLSTLLGALTWMVIAIIVPALVSLLFYYLLSTSSGFLYVNLASILLLLFNTFAACLITAGAALIAVSITGMYFPCVVVFGLVLLMPKVLLFIFTHQICSFLPFMTIHSFGILGSLRYSIPADLLLSMFTLRDITWWYASLGAGIYSLCFGSILMGLGLLLFQKRKSEAAGQSAPNTVLQHIYRTAVGLAVSLLPLMLLINDGFSLGVLFLYGLVIIACFAYELITTRKLRNLKRATVSLAALVVLNIMIFVGIFASCQILKGRKIEVAGFRNSEQLIELSSEEPSYEGLMIRDIVIDDAAVCQMVEDAYNRTVANGNNGSSYSVVRYMHYNVQLISENGGRFYRTVAFTQEEYSVILAHLAKNEEYRANYSKMPQAPESFTVSCVGNREYDRQIYESLLKEAENFSFEQRQALLQAGGGPQSDVEMAPGKELIEETFFVPDSLSVVVSGSVGTVGYKSQYWLSESLTPKTYQLALSYRNKKNREKIESFLAQYDSYDNFSIALNLKNIQGTEQPFLSVDKYDEDTFTAYCNDEHLSGSGKRIEVLRPVTDRLQNAVKNQGDVTLNMPILEIEIYGYAYESAKSVDVLFCVNSTQEEFDAIKEQIFMKNN